LRQLCAALPAAFPAAILVVMHLSPHNKSSLVPLLKRSSALPVEAASADRPLAPGCITVAVPDRHLIVTAFGQLALPSSGPINFARPAIDPLFASVAEIFRENATAVLLTGVGSDGTLGAERIKAHGGTVFAQNPASSVAPGMPQSAIRRGFVDHVLPLAELGAALVTHIQCNGLR
jgi:two-component system chemotaxis response regulator CheB